MTLTETQIDLLKETFNIGVGQAAASLSELAGGDEILLSVPNLTFEDVATLIEKIRASAGDRVCGVRERFRGAFSGTAMMLYSQQESLELVKIMLGETIPVEAMSEMEGEALCEVGNIILNAVISALADLFGSELLTDIPELSRGEVDQVFEDALGVEAEHLVLHLHMDFALASHRLEGHIGFFLDMAAVEAIATRLDTYLRNALGT